MNTLLCIQKMMIFTSQFTIIKIQDQCQVVGNFIGQITIKIIFYKI